jgi:hypothetical protein
MKALTQCLLWLALLVFALIASWAVWFRPKAAPIVAVQAVVAETLKQVAVQNEEQKKAQDSPVPAPPHNADPFEAVYRIACDEVKRVLLAPATAVFSDYISELNPSVKAWNRNVYSAAGWVDSQNGFGALIRNNWIVGIVVVDGKLHETLFVQFGEHQFGDVEDIWLVAEGLPRVAQYKEIKERQDLAYKAAEERKHQEELAVANRGEYYSRAQTAIRKMVPFPQMAKFSTLSETDNQYALCRRIRGTLWEARGISDYLDRAGKKTRSPWKVIFQGSPDGSIRPLFQEIGDVQEGQEATALAFGTNGEDQ